MSTGMLVSPRSILSIICGLILPRSERISVLTSALASGGFSSTRFCAATLSELGLSMVVWTTVLGERLTWILALVGGLGQKMYKNPKIEQIDPQNANLLHTFSFLYRWEIFTGLLDWLLASATNHVRQSVDGGSEWPPGIGRRMVGGGSLGQCLWTSQSSNGLNRGPAWRSAS